jgi:hypothetical protein
MEIFLYFADISDMREKSLHIPDIKVLCGQNTLNIFMKLKFESLGDALLQIYINIPSLSFLIYQNVA